MNDRIDPLAQPLASAQLTPTPRVRRLAMAAMLGAVAIYGLNFVISRHALLAGFTPYDLAALRFGFAGLILLPLFLKSGGFQNCGGVGWGKGLALTCMSGFPMSLLMLGALSLAPVAHGATIGPGLVSTISVVGGAYLFGQRLTRQTIAGLAVVLVGLGCFALGAVSAPSPSVALGDALFVLMALLWAGYPLALQKWRIDPLVAASVLCVLSLAYLPLYIAFLPGNLAAVAPMAIVLHAFNQAVLNMIVGLWLWGWATRAIGASESGRFPPLIPVVGTLSAIPVLGEWPGPYQWAALALIVGGLGVASWRR